LTSEKLGPETDQENHARTPEEFSPTDVPGCELMTLLAQGIRAEALGDLEGATALFAGAAHSADPALAAEALTRLADARRSGSAWSDALAAARRAQEVARVAGLEPLELHGMIAEANVLLCRGDFAEARALFEQVLARSAEPRMRGLALQNIGSILAQRGELGAAERYFAESYGQFQCAGYRRGEATALNNYGRVTFDRGDLPLAESLLRQAVAAAREVGHGELIALTTHNLAEVVARLGDIARAEDLAHEALGFFAGSGNRWREIECLRLIGTINEQRGETENAVRCYERGLRIAEEVGAAFEARRIAECLRPLRLGTR
jgi:tetratricopeptide (TPR) repeat protein